MIYKIFYTIYYEEKAYVNIMSRIETKGENRKVLRAAIKDLFKNKIVNSEYKIKNIVITDIEMIKHYRIRQVFQAENEYEDFINKELSKKSNT